MKRKSLVAGGVALAALAFGGLWYGRTYPPALNGVWTNEADGYERIVLTLHPNGNAYFKYGTTPEQAATWSADGNKVKIVLNNPTMAALLTSTPSADIIATRDDSAHLTLDMGSTFELHQKE